MHYERAAVGQSIPRGDVGPESEERIGKSADEERSGLEVEDMVRVFVAVSALMLIGLDDPTSCHGNVPISVLYHWPLSCQEFLLVSVEVRLGRPRPRAAYSGCFAMWSAEHARRTQRHPELVLLRCCLRGSAKSAPDHRPDAKPEELKVQTAPLPETTRFARACGRRRYSACAPLRVFPILHPPMGPPHCDRDHLIDRG
jgi:hypothetical protein